MLKDVSSDAQTSAAFFFSQMADHGWSIHWPLIMDLVH
jgi:hypothetical protein